MKDDIDRRSLVKLGLGAGVSSVLAGCTGGQEETTTTESESDEEETTTSVRETTANGQDTLYVALAGEQETLDPRNIDLALTLTWKHLLFNSLVRLEHNEEDGSLQYVPDLAESYEWQTNNDGAVLQFVLREDVSFHNGDDLTAELVKEEVDYWRNPDTNSTQADILSHVNQVSVDNDYTVNFHSDDVFAPAPVYFSRYLTIANPHVREERGTGEFAINPAGAGTGPYELESYAQGNEIVLQRYDDYHEDDLPHFERAILKILPEQSTRTAQLKAGDVHTDGEVSTEHWLSYEDTEDVDTPSRPSPLFAFSALNHNVEPLGNKQVRKALRRAVNAQNFIEAVHSGQGSAISAPHLPGSWWHWPEHDQTNQYDPQSAQNLLEEAGYGDGFDLEMSVPPDFETMGAVVKSMWGEIGVNLQIQSVNRSTMYGNIVEGNYTSSIGNFFGNPDPDYFYNATGTPDGKWKSFSLGWENDEFTEVITDGRATDDRSRREELYNRATEIWADEMPCLLYAVGDNLDATRTELGNYWVSNDTLQREALREVTWNP